MSLVYTITILPHLVGSVVVDSMEDVPKKVVNITKTSLHLFYICSSVVNPVITIVGKPDYQKAFRVLIGRYEVKEQDGSNATQSESV